MFAGMTLDDLKHAQRERLIFLDHCMIWRGQANRRDLINRFGISMAQAALDFRTYLELAHKTPPQYDSGRKSYITAKGHKALAPTSLIDAFGILADAASDGLASALPGPERKANPEIIALLYQAIRSNIAIHISYTSITSGVDDGQWIVPTHFTSNGENVHLRAFSFKHGAYRNYLPIRIEPDSTFGQRPLAEPLPFDEEWETRTIIWLRPKSSLSDQQAAVARREYGFEGEFLRVETRKALEFFFDQRWGLNQPGARLERIKTQHLPPEQ